MDVIESLAGVVSSMLEFPVVGFLGRLVPASGSGAGQKVRRVSLLWRSYLEMHPYCLNELACLIRAVFFTPAFCVGCVRTHLNAGRIV